MAGSACQWYISKNLEHEKLRCLWSEGGREMVSVLTVSTEYDISIIILTRKESSMQAAFSEPARDNTDNEIRLGTASWDEGNGKAKSVKYTWFDKNHKACRGGELPVEALPQMLEFAIRKGFLKLSCGEEE
jgi:hypothetical protein